MYRAMLTLLAVALLLTAAPEREAVARRIAAFGQVKSGGTVTGRVRYCRSGRLHRALDIAAPCNRHAKAMLEGRRFWRFQSRSANSCSATGGSSAGNYMLFNGKNGFNFFAAHLNRFRSHSGFRRKGRTFAKVGSTGNSTGPHTHLANTVNFSTRTAWMTNFFVRNNACGRHPNIRTRVGKPRIS